MRLTNRPAPWWDGVAGYEIYVPSFADGNSDGMGDLLGVVDRLDYLGWLGIDIIWPTGGPSGSGKSSSPIAQMPSVLSSPNEHALAGCSSGGTRAAP